MQLRDGARVAPGLSMAALGNQKLHELMPGWVKIDTIDPVTEAIVCLKAWWELIGEASEFEHFSSAQPRAESLKFCKARGAPRSMNI